MEKAPYSSPTIRDHGSLVALTQQFDASFVAGTVKVLTLAAISAPLVPGSENQPDVVTMIPNNAGTYVPGGSGGGGGGGGVPNVPIDNPGAGGNAGVGSGGGTGGGSGGGLQAIPAESGGKLPFTGYAATTAAYLGAVFTMTGIAVRAKLRRRSQ